MTFTQIAGAILGVFFALGAQNMIDTAVSGVKSDFYRASLVMAGIIVLTILLGVAFRHLKDRITADLDRDWKKNLLHGLLNGDFEKVSSYHSGELINRINNDVRILDEGLTGMLPNIAAMFTRLFGAMAVLITMQPLFTLVIVLAGIAVVAITSLMRHLLKNLHKRVSEADGKVSGFIQETLEKLLMVQAMDVSTEVEKRADVLLDERYQLQRKRKNVSLAANTGISILSYAASFFTLIWCSFELLSQRMTFGALMAITQLVGQLQGPFVNMSSIIPQYVAVVAAAERLMELDELWEDKIPPAKETDGIYEGMTALCAENFSFHYDRDPIYKNAEFSLPKGSFAVITGASGIGKSTLLKIMLGVFKPREGSLYIQTTDGRIPIDRTTRRLFAYVPQENLILSGTLRDNLTLTCPEATEEQIQKALYISAMDEYISQFPKGLETQLGENGAGLSQGQAQRLAIARAVLSNSPVILLDESTSALDIETEKKVLDRIRELENRTCIAVTHRPAALEIASYKIDVEDGKITQVKL